MASYPIRLTLLLIIVSLSIFIGGAQSRPCKTIFISYTATISSDPSDQNPNSFFAVYRVIRPARPMLTRSPRIVRSYDSVTDSAAIASSSTSSSSSPVGGHTRDILGVVVALLFGAGCGALTSATIYLAWSLIAHNRYDEGDFSDEDGEIVTSMKMGYFQIPTETAAAAKEGYEGK